MYVNKTFIIGFLYKIIRVFALSIFMKLIIKLSHLFNYTDF